MARRVGAAFAALAATVVVIPIFVYAAPPQSSAAGVILPAGTVETIVLDAPVETAKTEPGATIAAHLRNAIAVGGRILAPAGSPVRLVVTEIRPAGAGASGQVLLHVDRVSLTGGLNLPLSLLHPSLTPLLVGANREDIVLPPAFKEPLRSGADLSLPPGTMLLAKTAEAIDATQPGEPRLMTPSPFLYSTDEPYSAFTPIPLATINPNYTPPPRGKRGRRGKPKPSPSPRSSPSASPTPTPTAAATPT